MNQTELTERALTVPEQANALIVTTSEQYEAAAEMLLNIKSLQKEINETFDPICKKAFDAHKEAVAQKKKVEAPLIEAERIIKPKMADYIAEQDRIKRAEEERLRAIAQKEEEDRRIAEAEQAAAEGKHEEAEAIISEEVYVAPVVVQKTTPNVSGISYRETWDYEIVDMSKIPREYWILDKVKISGVVRSMKGATNIPGVRVFSNKTVAAGRSGKRR